MALPNNCATVLKAAGYDPEHFEVASSGGVITIRVWDSGELGAQPSEQQIINWSDGTDTLPGGQLFSTWLAEHGGDPLLTLRRQAKEALESNADFSLSVDRAILTELLAYINTQRNNLNDVMVAYYRLYNYLDGLAGVTIPANCKINGEDPASFDLSQMPVASKAQAIQVIKDRIAAGDGEA